MSRYPHLFVDLTKKVTITDVFYILAASSIDILSLSSKLPLYKGV